MKNLKITFAICILVLTASCSKDESPTPPVAENPNQNPTNLVATVTTIAGSTQGFANGTGAAARFSRPSAIAIDASGNMYVTEFSNASTKIRKITPAGVVSTYAGNGLSSGPIDGAAADARFVDARGLAVNAAGDVLVGEHGVNLIRKITSSGVVSTFAGQQGILGSTNATGTAAQFARPIGVVFDSAGNLYVADSANNKIRKIIATGVVTTLAGSGTSGTVDGSSATAQFLFPSIIAVDASNNVYTIDGTKLRKITPNGDVSSITLSSEVSIGGIVFDATGNLYYTDGNKVKKRTPAGIETTIAGAATGGFADGTGANARFETVEGIAIDAAGSLYLCDGNNHKIRKITFQ